MKSSSQKEKIEEYKMSPNGFYFSASEAEKILAHTAAVALTSLCAAGTKLNYRVIVLK